MNNQISAATGDRLPVSVNTYHAQAKTSHVSYILSDIENNQEIAKGNLISSPTGTGAETFKCLRMKTEESYNSQ